MLVPSAGDLHRAQAGLDWHFVAGGGDGDLALDCLVQHRCQRVNAGIDIGGGISDRNGTFAAFVFCNARSAFAGVSCGVRFHHAKDESKLKEIAFQLGCWRGGAVGRDFSCNMWGLFEEIVY